MFHRVSEKMINFFADTMRISAVLNIQDSGLVVTQIFLYFPLSLFGMECFVQLQQHPKGIAPVAADIQFSMPPFTKQRGVKVCFNRQTGIGGSFPYLIFGRSQLRQHRGSRPRPHDLGSLKCIELFLQPPAGWSLSRWLHQYILVNSEKPVTRLAFFVPQKCFAQKDLQKIRHFRNPPWTP